MDARDREIFWNVLKDLHDNNGTSISRLVEVSKRPQTLCRFRPVTEHSLQQLQENKLFFSSADYYDDPFDTYFYIDVDQMVPAYEELRKGLSEGNEKFVNILQYIASFTRQDLNTVTSVLSDELLDFSALKGQLMSVRNSIQRKLFSICFCEEPFNETLWLKYAGNYTGFVQIYDFYCSDTFLCGKEEACKTCNISKEFPYVYPMYYSDERYDATKFALGAWLLDKISRENQETMIPLYNYIRNSLMWEIERISLIKKKCHENDQEWRMIRPAVAEPRSCIKLKPSKVIVGLRTPRYERRLIVSAAKIAGIQEIHELYINDLDKLDSRPIIDE